MSFPSSTLTVPIYTASLAPAGRMLSVFKLAAWLCPPVHLQGWLSPPSCWILIRLLLLASLCFLSSTCPPTPVFDLPFVPLPLSLSLLSLSSASLGFMIIFSGFILLFIDYSLLYVRPNRPETGFGSIDFVFFVFLYSCKYQTLGRPGDGLWAPRAWEAPNVINWS